MKSPERRRFLADAALMAGGGWLALGSHGLFAAAAAASEQRSSGNGWVNLSAAEAASVTALVDRIIPADELPSASELGVVFFIDQALGGFYADQAEAFRNGLRDLDARAEAGESGRADFAGLTPAEQDLLLGAIETTPFFTAAIFLTHCGLFSMPSRGGNRDKEGWALVGFDSRHAWQPPFGYYDALAAGAVDEHER